MMMKPMCFGIEVRISISSARSERREAGGGLVEQDEARRAGERQRDLELTLLAVAELADQAISTPVQVHGLDQVLGRLQQAVAGAAAGRSEKRPRETPRQAR